MLIQYWIIWFEKTYNSGARINMERIEKIRNIRKEIVILSNCILQKRWIKVVNLWNDIEVAILKNVEASEELYRDLNDSRECIKSKNYIRFYEILIYKIDYYLLKKNRDISLANRKKLINLAKKDNEFAMRSYRMKLWDLVNKYNNTDRIDISLAGMENVSLSIKEGSKRFKLFSDVNPWLESANFIYTNKLIQRFTMKDDFEVCILGFGGGHLIELLCQQYPHVYVNVFLPNLDIFKYVISNIKVTNILKNDMVKFIYDPLSFDFFYLIKEKIKKNEEIVFFIDRQELRACIRKADIVDRVLYLYSESEILFNRVNDERNKQDMINELEIVGNSIYNILSK